MNTSASYRITGKVQGVGFRYFVRTAALQRGLTGWVKNHGDGSVIGVVEGDYGLIVDFFKELKVGSRWSRVGEVENQPLSFTREFKSFEIRY